jgi:hypothetical protein
MPRAPGVSLPSFPAYPGARARGQTLRVPGHREHRGTKKGPLSAAAARRLSLRSLRQLKGASLTPDEETRKQLRVTRVIYFTFVRDRVWGAS